MRMLDALTIWLVTLSSSVAASVVVLAVVGDEPDPTLVSPILVGIGCDGPSAVAVAREEDGLPACKTIERHYLK